MEPIVYHRRGLGWLYYFFSVTFVAFGLLFLVVALGTAVDEQQPWSAKRLDVVAFAVGGLSWLIGAPQMWSMARTYGKNMVRLDGTRFALHSPGGEDVEFPFADVLSVTWNPGLRSRLCRVETKRELFSFDTRSCPKPGRVAKLIAERAGKPLVVEKS